MTCSMNQTEHVSYVTVKYCNYINDILNKIEGPLGDLFLNHRQEEDIEQSMGAP